MRKLTSVLIGVFYLLVVFFAIVMLTAVQLRSSAGAKFDTWRVNYTSNRALGNAYQQQLDEIKKSALKNDDELILADLCLKFFTEAGAVKAGLDPQVLAEVKEAREGRKQAKDLDREAGCVHRGFTTLHYDRQYYVIQQKDFEKQNVTVAASLKLANDQLAELVKVNQEYLAFKEMEKYWYSKPFILAPYDLLVLLLVMLMGALGGMARILRDYGASGRQKPPRADYFFLPMIGAVVAIGGFVLAKTGLLLLSSAKDETALSPFMIGLVGLISGLLAKEVIDRLAGAGRQILEPERGPSRGRKAASRAVRRG
jgi:hypothetical protein